MRKLLIAAWEVLEVVFVAVATVILIRSFIAQPFVVSGASMEPNFSDGHYLVIDEFTKHFAPLSRGQVVVFRPPAGANEFFIKRIVGLPGEQVSSLDGRITITQGSSLKCYANSAPDPSGTSIVLDEPYVARNLRSDDNFCVILSANQYFVMGDNREHSFDSRSFGPIRPESVVGTVRLRLWPVSDLHIFTAPHYSLTTS